MHPIRPVAVALAAAILAAPVLAQVPDQVPPQWRAEFPMTDFDTASVDLGEIISGGPPRDGIPAIWEPALPSGGRRNPDRRPRAGDDLRGRGRRPARLPDPLPDVARDRQRRGRGLPIAVTYCPLCNSAMVFDARIDGAPHTFGVSGKLRHSDMVMYDRETETWWQQATGEAIVGRVDRHPPDHAAGLDGKLGRVPDRNPDGLVMDEPDWRRAYGSNPYVGYDSARRPFLYQGEDPPHGIPPLGPRRARREPRLDLRAAARGGRDPRGRRRPHLDPRPGLGARCPRHRTRPRRRHRPRPRRAGRDLPHDIPFAFAFHASSRKGSGCWQSDRPPPAVSDPLGTGPSRSPEARAGRSGRARAGRAGGRREDRCG
jgi:hypothetical protein